MKKWFSCFCTVILICGIAFAGGSSESAGSQKDQLLWLYETATPEHEEHLKKDLIEVVNANASDYEFSIRFDANYDQNLRTQMLAGAGPDLCQTAGPSYVQEFAKEGYLYPLDEFAEKYGWYDIVFPLMIDLCSVNGDLYALPKSYESMMIFYNKTLFDENGWVIPETWDEFEELCAQIKASGIIPMVGGNASWRPATEHLVTIYLNHIAGPDNVLRALRGEIPWTDPVFVEAMTQLKSDMDNYFSPDYFSYADEDCLSVIADRTCAMYPSGSWNFQRMDEYFDETGDEWDWAPLPSADGVEYPLYCLGIGATLSINAKSARPEAVAELLNTLFTNKDVIVNLNVDWPGEWNLPINTISTSDFAGKIDDRYARCIEVIGDAVYAGGYGFTTWTFWPEKTDQYIWEEVEKLFLGTITPEQYLEGLDEVFQNDIKAGNLPILPQ